MTDTQPEVKPVIRVSHSQLGVWRRCRYKWHLSYQRRILGDSTNDRPMALGILIHLFMERGFRYIKEYNGGKFTKPPNQLFVPRFDSPYDSMLEMQACLIVTDFFNRFAERHFDKYRIVEVERRFLVPFRTPGRLLAEFEFIADLIVQSSTTGQLYVIDHKSGRKWTDEDVAWDPQIPAYIQFCREMGTNVTSGFVNWISTHDYKNRYEKQPKDLYELVPVAAHPSMKEGFLTELGHLVDEIYYKSDYPTQYDKSCKFCQYKEICRARRDGNYPAAELLIRGYRKKDGNYRQEPENLETLLANNDSGAPKGG